MENINTGIDYNTKPDYKIYDKAFKNDTNGFKIIGEGKVNAQDKLRKHIKSVIKLLLLNFIDPIKFSEPICLIFSGALYFGRDFRLSIIPFEEK